MPTRIKKHIHGLHDKVIPVVIDIALAPRPKLTFLLRYTVLYDMLHDMSSRTKPANKDIWCATFRTTGDTYRPGVYT